VSEVWYGKTSDEELGSAIQAHVRYLDERLAPERRRDEIHGVMYANRARLAGAYARALELMRSGGNSPLKLNITRSMIETVTARIAMDFPLVQVAADGAEWSYKLRARRMTRFITSKQEETGFRRLAPLAFRDACVRGTGISKVTSENGDICHERVPKRELYIDPLESRYGKARNAHRKMQYAKDVLVARFGTTEAKKSAIATAPESEKRDEDRDLQQFDRSNLVDVIESHHLPSKPDGEDGLHVISLANGTILHRAPWTRPRLPYAFLHWSPPDDGFWGTGLAEELAPIQWSIDRTVEVLDEGFRLGAPLRVFLQRSSKIIASQLLPRVGTIIECSGAAPEIKAPSNPVSDQQIRWLMQLIEQAYQIAGVSLMAAAAKKPSGIDSGEGLRVFHDFETERFQHVEGNYQNFALDNAELAIDEAKDIYGAREKDGQPLNRDFHAKWVHRDVVEKIPWADVDLARDCFKLKLKPVNALTGTLTHKLETAKMFAQSGLVSSEWILPLFDNPDIERFIRLQTSTFNYSEWFVEQLMDEDARMPQPDSVADLAFLEKHMKAGHLDAVVDGAPESVLKRFREALTTVAAKRKKATTAGQPAMAMDAGMAPGMGPGGPLPPAPAPTAMPGQALPNAPAAMAA
jgi:hypothetical protein